MEKLRIYPTSINERHLEQAVAALRDGQPLIYPTDSLYAIGCDALSNQAVERLCALRGFDPKRHTLSVVCADMSQASAYARIDNRAFSLMRDYTPGPVTFILPAATTLPKVFKGRKTVGIRIPSCPIATRLAAELGNPLLSMTAVVDPDDASISSDPETVEDAYTHRIDLMIDGGECGAGESTVVDLTDSANPQIIRQGIADIDL